jgi:hypothetical protein
VQIDPLYKIDLAEKRVLESNRRKKSENRSGSEKKG